MNEAELLSLFLEALQTLDSNFEFWLTVSFALLVASYLVTERLPKPLLVITVFLYLASTLLFMLRGMNIGKTLTSIRDQLEAMNSEVALISASENLFVAGLYFIVMIVGAIGTVAFVYWRYRRVDR